MESHLRAAVAGTVALLLLLPLAFSPTPVAAGKPEVLVDQGLNASEEPAFRKALRLLKKDPDVDHVTTVRSSKKRVGGCKKTGLVYWVYAKRGTICFTRKARGSGWTFSVQVVKGRNPIKKQNPFVLETLAKERAASTMVEDPTQRNLIRSKKITYPYAYERIVAELDAPRAGDFVIVQKNTADAGNKGGHAHLDLPQSRSTFLIAGRGARRSPLSAREEKKLKLKHPDIAPTVASAMGVHPYFVDTEEPATLLNGTPSETALLKRQDGRVLDDLLEPVFNTFVVSVDGLRPEDVTPTLMPNLTGLVAEDCARGGDLRNVLRASQSDDGHRDERQSHGHDHRRLRGEVWRFRQRDARPQRRRRSGSGPAVAEPGRNLVRSHREREAMAPNRTGDGQDEAAVTLRLHAHRRG